MIGVKPLSFSIRWARPSSLHKIHKEKKQKPHHGFISCQVYKRGFQKNEERKRSEEENEEMPDIEQLSPGGPWNISPKEWRVIKRVCDKLFPEGIDWGEFWSNDDYEAWYPGWRFHLENEGTSNHNKIQILKSNSRRLRCGIASIRRIHRWTTLVVHESIEIFRDSIRFRRNDADRLAVELSRS